MEIKNCSICGSDKNYLIDNRDEWNAKMLADDEDPDAIIIVCDECGYVQQINRSDLNEYMN